MEQHFALCRFYLTYPSLHFSLFLPESLPEFFLILSSITIFYCKFPYLIYLTSVILSWPVFHFIHHRPWTSSLPSICSHIIPVLSLYHPTPSHLHWQALVNLHEFLFSVGTTAEEAASSPLQECTRRYCCTIPPSLRKACLHQQKDFCFSNFAKYMRECCHLLQGSLWNFKVPSTFLSINAPK